MTRRTNTVVRVKLLVGGIKLYLTFGSVDPLLESQRIQQSQFPSKGLGLGKLIIGGDHVWDFLLPPQRMLIDKLLEAFDSGIHGVETPSGFLIECTIKGSTSYASAYRYRGQSFLSSVAETVSEIQNELGARVESIRTSTSTWILVGDTYVDVGLAAFDKAIHQ